MGARGTVLRALLSAVVSSAGSLAGCGAAEGEASAEGVSLFAEPGAPLPHSDPSLLAAFDRGAEVARRRFGPQQGLGPQYSATSCLACHEKPLPGGAASRYRDVFVRPGSGPDLQFQPQFTIDEPARADDGGISTGVRTPMSLFGLGLLAEIPVDEILAWADPGDADGDGISGRVNFERGFVGRFGGKAQIATLEGFVRLALLDHLGVTTDPVHPDALGLDHVPGPVGLPTTDHDEHPDPELAPDDVADLVVYVGLLAPPPPAPSTPEDTHGREVFEALGCDGCHRPTLLGPRGPVPAYTDLLLHDMGAALADGIEIAEATASEFRTPPLWGLAGTGPYLHDGRADSVDEAVRWHDGEAAAARRRYEDAPEPDRRALLAFLRGLGLHTWAEAGLLPVDAPLPPAGTTGGPMRALDPEAADRFRRGRALFDHDFGRQEGLGPLFNGDACRSCHFDPVLGGGGPSDVDVLRVRDGATVGDVAHRFSTHGVRPSAGAETFERRQTPTSLGLGLIDAVADAEILAHADPDDLDGDGISGIPSRLPDGRLGRFGWTAQVPTLDAFVRDALGTELGVTVAEAADGFGRTLDDDATPDPELDPTQLDDLTFFLRELGPALASAEHPDGREIFTRLACDACHVEVLHTAEGDPVPLYSDLLLHRVDEDPVAIDYRTPPLWGVAATAPYLHDGRAETIVEAIAFHEAEAAPSAEAFARLAPRDQEALVAFVSSR